MGMLEDIINSEEESGKRLSEEVAPDTLEGLGKKVRNLEIEMYLIKDAIRVLLQAVIYQKL